MIQVRNFQAVFDLGQRLAQKLAEKRIERDRQEECRTIRLSDIQDQLRMHGYVTLTWCMLNLKDDDDYYYSTKQKIHETVIDEMYKYLGWVIAFNAHTLAFETVKDPIEKGK